MVNLVEQLYRGTLDFNRVNFDFKHIEIRSVQRKISIGLIKNLIFNVKPLSYKETDSREKKFKIVYKDHDLTGYGNIIICVKIFNNCINIMTVYEDRLTASGGRRKSLKYPKKSYEEELEEKAFKKLRHYW